MQIEPFFNFCWRKICWIIICNGQQKYKHHTYLKGNNLSKSINIPQDSFKCEAFRITYHAGKSGMVHASAIQYMVEIPGTVSKHHAQAVSNPIDLLNYKSWNGWSATDNIHNFGGEVRNLSHLHSANIKTLWMSRLLQQNMPSNSNSAVAWLVDKTKCYYAA